MDITTEKNRIKNFYYSHKYTELIGNVGTIGKLSKEQLDLVDHALTSLLWGNISPTEFIHTLEKDCLLNGQQYTIVLTLVQQKLLDPLKEIFDAIYNPQPINKISGKDQPIVKASKKDEVIHPSFQATKIPAQAPININKDFDPLDMFDRAKNDTRINAQEDNKSDQEENIAPAPRIENQNIAATTKEEGLELKNEPIKEINSLSSNQIKVNQAAVLGGEENNNLLALQDSQTIKQFSQILKDNNPIVEKEDLNLYVSNNEPVEEIPKPLNPMLSAEINSDYDDMEGAPAEERTGLTDKEETANSSALATVDAQTAEPKETTIKENIAQSHLKFIQNNSQKIPEDKNYSKLLNAMTQKKTNQPPIVGTLRDTLAHPDKYSEFREEPKPKLKKYNRVKSEPVTSSIISSTESSSNLKSNAIMEEPIDNDIINLAKGISQERKTAGAEEETNTRPQPIVYNKQPKPQDDPFENINKNNQNPKETNKNPHVIDLS